MHQILSDIADKMQKSIETFQKELTRIRTGRATLSLLDPVRVQAYGSPMPLNQVASLTIPESRTIAIQPWDPQLIGEIERAIFKADLGLNPISDGKIVRINIPQLTEERRKELVKQVKKISEEYRVAVRNLRRDAIDSLKKMKKDKDISEDEQFKLQDEVQKKTDQFIGKIDEIMAEKEKEVMEV